MTIQKKTMEPQRFVSDVFLPKEQTSPQNLHVWISDFHDAVTADLLATWLNLNISQTNITWSWNSLSPYCQFFNSCPQNLTLTESILGNRWQTNPVSQAKKAYEILQQIPDFMRADIGNT
jgi:hypothetical protein